jgi:aspartyl-tRNA synthetase
VTTERTLCGAPRGEDAGSQVTVYGWVDRRRDMGGLIFLDVRDYSGILQVVVDPNQASEAHREAHRVRLEWVVRVDGTVAARPPGSENANLATGAVELRASAFTVLSAAKATPFPVNEDTDVDEQVRLKYRYLDLRRTHLQRNLRARASFIAEIRRAMTEQGFVEIETPMMIRATPEGARDYLVPSRLFRGSFFALPQSPQLYKQLCMVAGLDRYFQIARCMRDEDLRADRQPEFTQLDIEMSFVDEDDVLSALERAIPSAWNACEFTGGPLTAPFARITWAEAMENYGVDKPDTRFSLLLRDLTQAVRGSSFRVFADVVSAGGAVKGICVEGGADLSRNEIEGPLADLARAAGAKGLAYLWKRADGWQGAIAKFFSDEELEAIATAVGVRDGDCVLMVADKPPVVAAALGALRNHIARRRQLFDAQRREFVWVTDFPMFEESGETGAITPAHHPFTMLNPEDLDSLESRPLQVRSRAYDLVVNGREVGSGSIRITDPAVQRRVFKAIGLDEDAARQKFGFLLDAFEFGVPPHGGFAAGLERLVMEGLGEENIRDVIAFPKNQQAQEPMTEAPAPVEEAQLRDLGITVVRPGG